MNGWFHLAVGGAVAVLTGAVWIQTHRLQTEAVAHELTRAEYASYRTLAERQAQESAQRAREETDRRISALQEIVDDAEKRAASAAADAARAGDAGRRLRAQIAAVTARCRAASSDTDPAGSSAPDAATTDLLADVQRRLGEATERIARFADDAHRAGLTCERAYDGLHPRP